MTIHFNLKRQDQKITSLFVEFTKNGKKFKFYPGKRIEKDNWSVTKQQCLSGHTNSAEINAYLKSWKEELERIVDDLEARKIFLTKEVIQSELDKAFNKMGNIKAGDAPRDFITFYDQFIRSNKNYTLASISILLQNRKHVIYAFDLLTKKHKMEYEKLSSKAKSKMDLVPDKLLPFNQVNLSFLKTFKDYLYTAKFTKNVRGVEFECNYKLNYIGKHIKQLNQIVDAAIEAGHVELFMRKSIKAQFEEVDSIFTDFEELQRFIDLDLRSYPEEEVVRDKYVFNCFLGMRYSDLNKLEKHLFQWRTIEGKRHLIFVGRQIKTDNRVEFPIHANAVKILEKYQFELPKMHEVEFNKLIKIVAEKAGLTDLFRKRETRGYKTEQNDIPRFHLISTHTGRRSFCTNFYQRGVNIQAIMSVSGHKTEKEFLKYVKAGVKVEVMAEQLVKIPEFKSSSSLKVA